MIKKYKYILKIKKLQKLSLLVIILKTIEFDYSEFILSLAGDYIPLD
jgi:hypothetical protein